MQKFKVWNRNLMDWAAELIQDPLLFEFFEWDAQRLAKYNAETDKWVRFINEPWTGDQWYTIQVGISHDLNYMVIHCILI